MRPRNLLLLPVFALSVSVFASCSSDTATTATGPAAESTTTSGSAAPPPTADPGLQTGTTMPGESTTTTAAPVAPPTTKAPVTTRKPAPTTAKPAPPPTTRKVTPTLPPTTAKRGPTAPKQFCDWAQTLLVEDKSVSFQQYAQRRADATAAVAGFIPGEISQDYNVIVAGLDMIKPAIDSGEVTSPISATQWYARNDPGFYDQLVAAVQHVGAYRRAHC